MIKALYSLICIKEMAKYHSTWQIREDDYQKIMLKNVLELHILELLKTVYWFMNDDNKKSKSDLMNWLKLLINSNKIEKKSLK